MWDDNRDLVLIGLITGYRISTVIVLFTYISEHVRWWGFGGMWLARKTEKTESMGRIKRQKEFCYARENKEATMAIEIKDG